MQILFCSAVADLPGCYTSGAVQDIFLSTIQNSFKYSSALPAQQSGQPGRKPVRLVLFFTRRHSQYGLAMQSQKGCTRGKPADPAAGRVLPEAPGRRTVREQQTDDAILPPPDAGRAMTPGRLSSRPLKHGQGTAAATAPPHPAAPARSLTHGCVQAPASGS